MVQVRLGLLSRDDRIILRSKSKLDEYIVLDVAKTSSRAAHFCKRASASDLKGVKLYGISTGKPAATFGALGEVDKALQLEVADWRTTDTEGVRELTLAPLVPPNNDLTEANDTLQACFESLHDDVKDTAVLRGVACVSWAEDENPLTAAAWTPLPLATLQQCKEELMPLLLSLLGRQCEARPARPVTVGLRGPFAHLLLSVRGGHVDWTGADGQGRLLTYLDPVHNIGMGCWRDAQGQERWADHADMQVFLPQTDPKACVTPASGLDGVRILLDGDYRELAEVTLQTAAITCSGKGHGLLYYRMINLLDEDQTWLRDAFTKRGWWPSDSLQAPEVWASASADEPLLVTRRQEDPQPEQTVTSVGGGGIPWPQQGLRVVCTLRVEQWQQLLREAHESPGGPQLALVPYALKLLVHRHYVALPYSRGLLEQADNLIMQLHDISQQRHREKALAAAAAVVAGARTAAAPSAASAAPALDVDDVQSTEQEGWRRESCRHKQQKAVGAGPSGNQQARAEAARVPKRDTPPHAPAGALEDRHVGNQGGQDDVGEEKDDAAGDGSDEEGGATGDGRGDEDGEGEVAEADENKAKQERVGSKWSDEEEAEVRRLAELHNNERNWSLYSDAVKTGGIIQGRHQEANIFMRKLARVLDKACSGGGRKAKAKTSGGVKRGRAATAANDDGSVKAKARGGSEKNAKAKAGGSAGAARALPRVQNIGTNHQRNVVVAQMFADLKNGFTDALAKMS